jgi:hypothetical protein
MDDAGNFSSRKNTVGKRHLKAKGTKKRRLKGNPRIR